MTWGQVAVGASAVAFAAEDTALAESLWRSLEPYSGTGLALPGAGYFGTADRCLGLLAATRRRPPAGGGAAGVGVRARNVAGERHCGRHGRLPSCRPSATPRCASAKSAARAARRASRTHVD